MQRELIDYPLPLFGSRCTQVIFPKKGERIIMCPYADMINHNPYANTYIVAERSLLPVGGTRDVVTIYADKDYKRFEQVIASSQLLVDPCLHHRRGGDSSYGGRALASSPLPSGVYQLWAQVQC